MISFLMIFPLVLMGIVVGNIVYKTKEHKIMFFKFSIVIVISGLIISNIINILFLK